MQKSQKVYPSRIFSFALIATNGFADTVLVEDSLVQGDPFHGSTNGGAFTAEGWSQSDGNAQLVYDLGRGVDCGSISIQVRNWDPRQNMIGINGEDDYHNVLSLYQKPHGSPKEIRNVETHVIIQVVGLDIADIFREKSAKLNAYSAPDEYCGECGGAMWTEPRDQDWDAGETYTFSLSWSWTRVELSINAASVNRWASVEWSFPQEVVGVPRIELRYVFLGKDNCPICGKKFAGPVYRDLRIIELEPCDGPCEGHCGNGVQDCGEEGTDCGGACAPCGTEPPGQDGGMDSGADAGRNDAPDDRDDRDAGQAEATDGRSDIQDAGRDGSNAGHDDAGGAGENIAGGEGSCGCGGNPRGLYGLLALALFVAARRLRRRRAGAA